MNRLGRYRRTECRRERRHELAALRHLAERQYDRLGVHVAESPRAVVRAAHRLLAPAMRRSRAKRTERHAWLRAMLKAHADARSLYHTVMTGRLGVRQRRAPAMACEA